MFYDFKCHVLKPQEKKPRKKNSEEQDTMPIKKKYF